MKVNYRKHELKPPPHSLLQSISGFLKMADPQVTMGQARLKLSNDWDDLGYPHDLGNLRMFVCEIPPVETANTTPLRLRHALRPGVARC